MWCSACSCRVGSSKQDVDKHVNKTNKHKEKVAELGATEQNAASIQQAIHDFKGIINEERGDGVEIKGLSCRVPMDTQVARAECLEEFLKAGIPIAKINKLRPWLEKRMGVSLCRADEMAATYIPPLKIKVWCRLAPCTALDPQPLLL